ncbi:hypothetical protein HOY82DRAFT_605823 [Tuber indicum]|nr:hypothetical protein HOY82DRAFT_605823 [Tuber indicum]
MAFLNAYLVQAMVSDISKINTSLAGYRLVWERKTDAHMIGNKEGNLDNLYPTHPRDLVLQAISLSQKFNLSTGGETIANWKRKDFTFHQQIPLKSPRGENKEEKVRRLYQLVRITDTGIQSIACQWQLSLFLLASATENIGQDRLLGIIEGVDKRKLRYRLKAGRRWSRLVDEFSIVTSKDSETKVLSINIQCFSSGDGDNDQPKTPAGGEDSGNMQDNPPNREGSEILDNYAERDNGNQLKPPASGDGDMDQAKTPTGGEGNGNILTSRDIESQLYIRGVCGKDNEEYWLEILSPIGGSNMLLESGVSGGGESPLPETGCEGSHREFPINEFVRDTGSEQGSLGILEDREKKWPIGPDRDDEGQTGPFTTIGFEHYHELGGVGAGEEVASPISSKFSPWGDFSPSAASESSDDFWSSWREKTCRSRLGCLEGDLVSYLLFLYHRNSSGQDERYIPGRSYLANDPWQLKKFL